MDPMLNPAHVLVGTHAKNRDMAVAFADWIIMEDGGQKVIKNFEKYGALLYKTAPKEEENINPLGKAKTLLG